MEQDLKIKGLPLIPFHASPLMNGKDEYKSLDMECRKRLFAAFEAFCRRTPFTYKTFAYKRSEVPTPEDFIARLKRDLVVFLSDNLEYFQAYSKVKIYYDNGQRMVTSALHDALEFMLSKDAILYKTAAAKLYSLSQVADCICALELTDLKFKNNELTATDIKIFGTNYAAFKRNHLKHIRRKAIGS